MNICHEKLKLYMKLKGDIIKKKTGIDFYCSDEAIESIKRAKEVWEKLVENIINFNCLGLGFDTCPFCLYFGICDNCDNCSWAKENGDCMSNFSLFDKVDTFMDNCNITISNEEYQKIIKKIEEETKLPPAHNIKICTICNGTGQNPKRNTIKCFACNGQGEVITELKEF